MRELYVRARVFPTSISTYLSPALGVTFFFPLLARGLIPRLIAHAEQTIFFFYYFVRVRIVRFVSIKFPALVPLADHRAATKSFEETRPRGSESNRMTQNLITEKN